MKKMEKRSILKLIGPWLKARKYIILLFGIIIGMNGVVLWAYHTPNEVISYGQFLAVVIFLFAGAIDFFFFVRKYHSILELYENVEWSLKRMIDSPHAIEYGYQQVIKKIFLAGKQYKQESESQLMAMNDYYTLWAHQIKTPIAAMHLLLENEMLPDEVGFQLEAELFRIEQYAQMVLQYLRLESMASDMVIRTYDLYEIVKICVKKYAKSFIAKRISLEFEPFKGQVLTDEKWLSFVIEQLLSNSLKYTRPEGKVSISFKQDEKSGEKRLLIGDTGIGIKAEDLPRVFDRGFTGFNGRMDKRSTGIGLYLCKKITNQLAHEINIASHVGQGTTVAIIFKVER